MITPPATPQQLQAIGAACNAQGLSADVKATIVSEITNGRCTSSKGMSQAEATTMLRTLNEQTPKHKAGDKQRKYIIAMWHEMGKHIPGTQKVDMKALDTWCIEKGHAKKKLDQYTPAELTKLVVQCEGYLQWYLKTL